MRRQTPPVGLRERAWGLGLGSYTSLPKNNADRFFFFLWAARTPREKTRKIVLHCCLAVRCRRQHSIPSARILCLATAAWSSLANTTGGEDQVTLNPKVKGHDEQPSPRGVPWGAHGCPAAGSLAFGLGFLSRTPVGLRGAARPSVPASGRGAGVARSLIGRPVTPPGGVAWTGVSGVRGGAGPSKTFWRCRGPSPGRGLGSLPF